ncbi:hypothetical protein KAW18_01010 [candidate division WOR-3 bacterium]|nr:hypothetical protein [candidate division WOR-3 bacterium]
MQQVKIVTLDDGNFITKIDKALQKLGKDIANRPEVTSKRVVTIKIGLVPAESYVAVDYQIVGLEPPDAPVRTIAFMDGTILVKQLPLFDNIREAPSAAAPRSAVNQEEAQENNG